MRKLALLLTLAGLVAAPAATATAGPPAALAPTATSVVTSPLSTATATATPTTIAADKPASWNVEPLPQAHAHNDYEHDRPLRDALSHGFTSVEVDVYLVDGQLLVGHDPEDLDPERTLQSLYLEPLRHRVLAGHGAIYRGYRGELFQLLVDIKNTGAATYAELDEVLSSPQYRFLFTRYANDDVHKRPVTVVVSGDRPREVMEAQTRRFAFYDGCILNEEDLGLGADAELVPLVSDNWTLVFTWTGAGEMPADERALLHDIVATAHDAGQRVRFWATPDEPGPERTAVWNELEAADVDHINTDDLAGLAEFLRD